MPLRVQVTLDKWGSGADLSLLAEADIQQAHGVPADAPRADYIVRFAYLTGVKEYVHVCDWPRLERDALDLLAEAVRVRGDRAPR